MNIRAFSATAVLVMLGACTSSSLPKAPLQPGSTLQVVAPKQTAAAPTSAAAAPTSAVAATPVDAATPTPQSAADSKQLDKKARTLGYRIEFHEGRRFYCRPGLPTGSHIPANQCITPEAFEEGLNIREAQQYKVPTNTGCLSPSCKGN